MRSSPLRKGAAPVLEDNQHIIGGLEVVGITGLMKTPERIVRRPSAEWQACLSDLHSIYLQVTSSGKTSDPSRFRMLGQAV